MIEIILWLNDLPTWNGAVIVICGALLFAYLGMMVSRILFTPAQLIPNNVAGGFQYAFAGHTFAVFVGFLLFGVYESYDQVREEILLEANALTELDRLSIVFPPATRDLLQSELRSYAKAVADVEWPQMRKRVAGPVSEALLDDLYRTFQTIEPTSQKQEAVVEYTRELMEEVRHSRGLRLLRSLGSMQILLWAVTVITTVVLIIYPWVFGNPNFAATFVMTTLVVIIIMTVNFSILKMSYPFDGSHGITPEPFYAYLRSMKGFP